MPTPARQRLVWPDVARGVAILGLVILHVSIDVPGGKDTFLAALNYYLGPIRLPLFFVISGYFGAKLLRFNLRDLIFRRLWFFAVPYAFFSLFEARLKRNEILMKYPGLDPKDLETLPHMAIAGDSVYWFLYCLVICTCILWITRRLPDWLAMVVSFAPLGLLMVHEQSTPIVYNTMLFLPVFVAGARIKPAITWLSEHTFRWTAIVPTVGLGALGFWMLTHGVWHTDSGLPYHDWAVWNYAADPLASGLIGRLFSQLLIISLAIAVARILSLVPAVARPLQFVGSHTLVIYLGHPLAMTFVFNTLFYRYDIYVLNRDNPDNPLLWSCICFVLCAAGSYFVWLWSKVPVLGWVVVPPQLLDGVAGLRERLGGRGSGGRFDKEAHEHQHADDSQRSPQG